MNYDKEDPITGYIAFERILDRLLEEAREGHTMREKIGDHAGDLRAAEGRIRQLEEDLRAAAAQIAKRERGDQKLGALHSAAMAVVQAFADTSDGRIADHLVVRLGITAKEAEEFCDPIPF